MNTPVAIITGAGGGIGCAIALTLARKGWRLVLADRSQATLENCRRQCAALSTPLHCVPGDISREEDVAALIDAANSKFGGCQGFVSNAGAAGAVAAIEDYPSAAFHQLMAVNVLGAFFCLKYALPLLRQSGGSFVAIASTSAIRGRANMSGYVASKHALLGLVRSSALECVGSNVRVNAVLPGPTQTAMIEEINQKAAQRVPGGGITRALAAPYGQPQDVANTVAFLLADESRHMNGAALVTDAGSTLA